MTPGDKFIVKILEWSEAWEFDRPIVMLEPVTRFSPDSITSPESMCEDVFIDATIDERFIELDFSREFEVYGWKVPYLRKIYRDARKGKKFPKKKYIATEFEVTITYNKEVDGLLFSMKEI